MARYENKRMTRISKPETGYDVFQNERLTVEYDLSKMRFLWRGVDTIRQLYNASIRPDVFDQISNHWDNKSTDVINIGGIDWKLSSSGKRSGYKFILKNLNYGFVVLLKSFYCEMDQHGPHLKIEATPQVIYELGLERLTNELRKIANMFCDAVEASGVAVHLALDVKGLDVPENFEQNLVCRSKRQLSVSGISSLGFENMSTAAYTYGNKETFMFGDSDGVQFCLYNKSKEAVVSDKIDFMQMIWRDTPGLTDPFIPEYNDGRDTGEGDIVHRLEFRIHHRIIKEFENGHFNKTQVLDDKGRVIKPGELVCIREARDLTRHLDGFWRYCLKNFRLQHSTTYIHPIWQKVEEDVNWFGYDDEFLYVRDQKKSAGVVGRRNVAMMIGNMIKLAARKGLTADHLTTQIMSLGLDSDIADYFGMHLYGNTSQVWHSLYDFVEGRLTDHRLNGVSGHNWSTAYDNWSNAHD